MRYTQEAEMDNYSIRLTSRHAREARELGNGNRSRGIRWAIEVAKLVLARPDIMKMLECASYTATGALIAGQGS